jgi:hypothetical protein
MQRFIETDRRLGAGDHALGLVVESGGYVDADTGEFGTFA